MIPPAFSQIIAGTMTWGEWGKKFSSRQMADLIQGCVDLGITSFDHADIYGNYTTEADFGKAFKESGIGRNAVQFISKCGIQFVSEQRKSVVKHYDYAAEYIIWSAEQSLKKLQTDYLDLLLLHRPSPLMETDEIANAIEKLKIAGKILDFGVSNFTPSQTELIATKTKVNYNQIEFSITHFEPVLNGSLDHMQMNHIRPMCWSPLGTVFKKDNPQSKRILVLAKTLAMKYEVSIEAVLMAWILRHPVNIIPIFGTTDLDRITALKKATTIEMELQDWFLLWTASTGVEVP